MNRLFTWLDSIRGYAVYDRPIFVLSAPRSGSTFLFEMLRQFDEAWAYQGEADHVWVHLFPPERFQEPSSYVGPEDASPRKINQLRRALYRQALWTRETLLRRVTLTDRLGLRSIRYVDKSIASCFHLDVIEKVFPDARYIFLLRDPRPTISSMLAGQKGSPRHVLGNALDPATALFVKDLYSYPFPPGWSQHMSGHTDGEAYAWAWCQFVTSVDEFLRKIEPERQLLVVYETFLENLEDDTCRIARFCDFQLNEQVAEFIRIRPHSRTTATPPDANKWRRLHGELMADLSPIYEPTLNSIWSHLPMGRQQQNFAPAR